MENQINEATDPIENEEPQTAVNEPDDDTDDEPRDDYPNDDTDDDGDNGNGNRNVIAGTEADDLLRGTANDDTIVGDDGNDTLYGEGGDDSLKGSDGDDDLYGGEGDDFMAGQRGKDKLWGDEGKDTLSGGEDDDTLYGGRDDDKLYGDRGNDDLYGDEGHDRVYGGKGYDTLSGGEGDDDMRGQEDDDILYGERGDDKLYGDEGHDSIYGGEGDDFLSGGKGDDHLYGDAGDDRLFGYEGDDHLYGGEGDDTLRGFEGDDSLTGDAGKDVFVFSRHDYDEIAQDESGEAEESVDYYRGLAVKDGIAYALAEDGSSLIRFSVGNPGEITSVTLGGDGDKLTAIDFRPETGELYGYSDDTDTYYTVDVTSGELSIASTTVTETDSWKGDIDWNPTIDRLRTVTESDQNIVYNPEDGTASDTATTPLAYAAGDANEGVDPNITGNAYSNNRSDATETTQYVLDHGTNTLATLANNTGQLTTVAEITVDGQAIDFESALGFDIATDEAGNNTAYAVLSVSGDTSLYTINLQTGAATRIDTLGNGNDGGSSEGGDIVTDFSLSDDILQLFGFGTDSEAILATASGDEDSVTFDLGDGITLRGISIDDINQIDLSLA